jgi:predicted PurR-regulated permease PerM
MESIVLTLLSLVQSLLPQIGVDSAAVTKVIAALIQIVPLVASLSSTVIQSVQNVIAALKNSGDLTADQLSALDTLSAEIDANWDSSVTAYLASKKKLTPVPVPAASSVSSTASETAAVVVQPVAVGV